MLNFRGVIVIYFDLGPDGFGIRIQVALKFLHANHQLLLVTLGHSRGVLPSTLAPKHVGWLLNGAGSCMSFDKGGVFRCESFGMFRVYRLQSEGLRLQTEFVFINVFPKLGWLGFDFWRASHVVHLEFEPTKPWQLSQFLRLFLNIISKSHGSQRLSHKFMHACSMASFTNLRFDIVISASLPQFWAFRSSKRNKPHAAMGHKTRQKISKKSRDDPDLGFYTPWKIQTFPQDLARYFKASVYDAGCCLDGTNRKSRKGGDFLVVREVLLWKGRRKKYVDTHQFVKIVGCVRLWKGTI